MAMKDFVLELQICCGINFSTHFGHVHCPEICIRSAGCINQKQKETNFWDLGLFEI